jgi:maltose O-acetyltransferase
MRKIINKKYILLVLYYYFARFLPSGKFGKFVRYHICKRIFKKCGNNVNVERLATFGKGFNIEIGDNSGIGINAHIPNNTIIGNNVMMGPNVYILSGNHEFGRTDIPMIEQGLQLDKRTFIEDDCWIGRNVLMTPGRTIKKGSIIAAGCVLCKDFPEYSIVGGNPSKLIKSRMANNE